jgi:hypothetical protein
VSLAFVLAITMMISSSPETKVVDAAACTIDATEIDGLNTVVVGTTNDTDASLAVVVKTVAATGAGMGFGSLIDLKTALVLNETVRLSSVTDATNIVLLERGVGSTIDTNITANDLLVNVKKHRAANGVDCSSTVDTSQTVTVNSDSAQVVEVWQLLRDPVPQATTGVGTGLNVAATNMSGVASATDTTVTLVDATTTKAAGDVATVQCTTPSTRYEQMQLVTVGTNNTDDTVVKRAVNGSTACETITTAASNWYIWHDSATLGANGTMVTINDLASKDTFAERRFVNVNTPRTSGGYTGSFTVKSTAPGKALIGVKGSRAGVIFQATTADSQGLIHMTFKGAPSDYVDDNADGKYTAAADTDRSKVTNGASVGTSATTTMTQDVTFEIDDALGQDLVGTATVTMAGAPSTVKFTNSGSQSIVLTTGAGTETTAVSGLPGTGNFRYTYSVSYTGTTGNIDVTGGIIHRTNNTLSNLTMTLQNRNYGATVWSDVTSEIRPQTVDDGSANRTAATVASEADQEIDGIYALYVVGTDSAGNPANALVSFTDDDGSSTVGLGNTTGIFLDSSAYTSDGTDSQTVGHVGTLQLGATGKARTTVDIAAAGIYNLTAKDQAAATSASLTLNVRGVATTYTLTGPDSIEPGQIGVFTVWGYDANGWKLSTDKAVTIVNANSQTGGAIVPANGAGTISKSTGLTISVIAPQKGGTGTLAIVSGGAVVASKNLTYAAAVTGAALSGTGCTGAATGSYTCVVTSGDTASAVATAAGAVSIWQSDADGVLQGYVVGTPDFVDTGLASTAAIADNSAIIVVR